MKILFSATILTFFVTISLNANTGNGKDGQAGMPGSSGKDGKRGNVSINFIPSSATAEWAYYMPIKACATEEVQNILENGLNINSPIGGITGYKPTAFQLAIESRCLDIVKLMIFNPDISNRPNLRHTFTNSDGQTLNTYQLLLIDNALDPSSFYIRQINFEILKLIIAYETDADLLEAETRELLNYLSSTDNKYASYPRNLEVQNAIGARVEELKR